MKKDIIIIIFLSVIFSNVALFSCPFDDCINDGLTKATAYEIWTLAHLYELGDSIASTVNFSGPWNWAWGKHFRLMQDVVEPVTKTLGVMLTGFFYGGGHKIIVEIDTPFPPTSNMPYLFPALNGGSLIDSLTVNGYISGSVAGIVGNNGGTISNCIINATIININPNGGGTGGIANANSGIISNCVFNGSITGVDRIGGIAGDIETGGQIFNCINNGKIIATASGGNGSFSGVGGIVGTKANAGFCVISNNINNGIVEGQDNVGGIVGLAVGNNLSQPPPVLTNINYGFIKGTNAVGGILGNAFAGTINIFNNFNSGVVIGVSETGCIVGRNTGGTISNNHYDKQMCP